MAGRAAGISGALHTGTASRGWPRQTDRFGDAPPNARSIREIRCAGPSRRSAGHRGQFSRSAARARSAPVRSAACGFCICSPRPGSLSGPSSRRAMRPSSRSTLACSRGRWISHRPRRACQHLNAHYPKDEMPDLFRGMAAATEDAFDAAVSALEMARARDALRRLPDGDEIDCLFGRIWSHLCRDADHRSRSVNALRACAVLDRRIGATCTRLT